MLKNTNVATNSYDVVSIGKKKQSSHFSVCILVVDSLSVIKSSISPLPTSTMCFSQLDSASQQLGSIVAAQQEVLRNLNEMR